MFMFSDEYSMCTSTVASNIHMPRGVFEYTMIGEGVVYGMRCIRINVIGGEDSNSGSWFIWNLDKILVSVLT